MRPSITRRRALQMCSLGVLGSLAGCGGSGESEPSTVGTDTSDAPRSDPPTSRENSERALPVRSATVQPGVLTLRTDYLAMEADAGQYLVVDAAASERGGPPLDAIRFAFDGTEYRPLDPQEPLYHDRGGGYDTDDGGWLVFPLPETGSAGDARLRWPGGEWKPPRRVRDRLGTRLPPFDVTFSAPDSLAEGATPTLTISATNRGSEPGRCVLGLTRHGPKVASKPVRRFAFDLDPWESVTRTHEGKPPLAEWQGEPRNVTYALVGPGGTERSRTLRPEDLRTPTPEPPRVAAVSEPSVQAGVVRLNVDALGVDDDPQYLLTRVAVPDDGRGPERDAFAFLFDGYRYAPHPATEDVYVRGGAEGYTAEDGGWLVFGLPETGSPDEVGLRWPDRGSWVPPRPVGERLASPTPSFAVEFDVPGTPTAGDPPTLSVTVENTGENPGRCVLSLTRSGPEFQSVSVRRFAFDLDPGESATRTHDGKLPERGNDPREVVYTLDRPGGDAIVRELAPGDVETTASESE